MVLLSQLSLYTNITIKSSSGGLLQPVTPYAARPTALQSGDRVMGPTCSKRDPMASLTKSAAALSRVTTTPWLYSFRAKSPLFGKTGAVALLTHPPAWTVERGAVHPQHQEPEVWPTFHRETGCK